jgi:hypothetical protein
MFCRCQVSLIILSLLFVEFAVAQTKNCREKEVAATVYSPQGAPIPKLTEGSLQGTYGGKRVSIRSVAQKQPHRIILILDTSGSLLGARAMEPHRRVSKENARLEIRRIVLRDLREVAHQRFIGRPIVANRSTKLAGKRDAGVRHGSARVPVLFPAMVDGYHYSGRLLHNRAPHLGQRKRQLSARPGCYPFSRDCGWVSLCVPVFDPQKIKSMNLRISDPA